MVPPSETDLNHPPIPHWYNHPPQQTSNFNTTQYSSVLKNQQNTLAPQLTYALFNQFFQQQMRNNNANPNNHPNNAYEPSNPQKRARTNFPDQSHDQSLDQNNSLQSEPKKKIYISKFVSNKEFPTQLRSYVKLQNEIKRCKPNAKILNAYVNSKNQLVIRTNCEESSDYLKADWTSNAFIHGIKKIENNPKFYIALHNLNTDFDVDDEENKEYMLNNFKITSMLRIFKKSENKPLDLVKAIINDREDFNEIIENKTILVGCSRIRVSPWKFDVRPDQCFHCQKIGHFAEKCPDKSKNPTCLKCSKKHSYKNCPNNDPSKYRCANCNGNHAACSKSCEIIINEVKRKKELLEKKTNKTASKFTRNESAQHNKPSNPSVDNNNMNNMILFIIEILKKFNNIHEIIYEKPNEISKLVTNHFGLSCGRFIHNHLSQASAEEEMEEETNSYDE
ncbi:unnamed protein product [Brachionus calyciflorus]|uniref:CCHC-type domain-containing protein n=1 Tax=Brachionus calyciflorus TaxID=104777 RepID=A0A813ZQX3_9BILA|nr:unnamed protein product [Brachionus calyciflorus]